MQLKDRVKIKIESIAFGGEGVGRIDNFVVFVPFSAIGDELEIEIIQMKKNFLRGRLLKIIKPSQFRVKPLCRYYEKCGGCCYQHLKYEHQLKIKQKQIEEAFWKIGKIVSPPVLEPIAAPKIYHYRGKAQYHAQKTANGWQIGFLDISGGKLVNVEHCEIMEETINEKLMLLRNNNQLLDVDDEQLTIWSDFFTDQENKKGSIVRMVKGKNFLVPRDGFFQTNLYLTDQLVDEVCRFVAMDEINTVVDAYCGSGLFSVFLSPLAKNVLGIEVNEKSVRCARINTKNSGLQNVKFICGDARDVLRKKLLPSNKGISLIILDPPRSGCEKAVLKAIADLKPLKIIYVSCNPATQARDVKYLNESGYDLRSLLPVDMFPQTEHIEVVGLMERILK
ncbi:MAG: hypothetical protein APR62_09035 [Smithella sp. SDB]|nr:MAG: hypothetical protein APR62_09035 [Smithella sp. SDB]